MMNQRNATTIRCLDAAAGIDTAPASEARRRVTAVAVFPRLEPGSVALLPYLATVASLALGNSIITGFIGILASSRAQRASERPERETRDGATTITNHEP